MRVIFRLNTRLVLEKEDPQGMNLLIHNTNISTSIFETRSIGSGHWYVEIELSLFEVM